MSDPGTSYVVGRNPVREALERADGRIEKVLLQQGAHGSGIDDIRREAKALGVPVQMVPSQRLQHLAGDTRHQGVVAILAAVAYVDLDDMLSAIAPDLDTVQATRPLLVALDEIEDPHNFGAILRSVVAAGGRGVLVPERHMAPLSATVIKASAGTALQLPIARVGNLADSLENLKERGYWIVGLDGTAETTIWTMDWARPLVLVVGNEGRGLRTRVQQVCDFLVSIPMRGPAESLNASVAAGVALFAATRGEEGV